VKDVEMVIAGGGKQEHEFRRTSEEKSWNGKDKEDKTRTSAPQSPEIKKRKNAKPSDESDSESQDKLALMPKNSVDSEGSQVSSIQADLRSRGSRR
jgi:hypothetical protein